MGFFSVSRDILELVIIRVRPRPLGHLKALIPFNFNVSLIVILDIEILRMTLAGVHDHINVFGACVMCRRSIQHNVMPDIPKPKDQIAWAILAPVQLVS